MLVLVGASAFPANAQLSIELAGTREFPETALDQHGQPIAIAELSGVTWLGDGVQGPRFAAVMDSGGVLVQFDLRTAPDGAPLGFENVAALRLDRNLDFEGVAPGGADTVFIAEEGSPGVREFSLATGAQVRSLSIPPVFAQRRSNRGFESLTRDGDTLWTANEEALNPDGPRATPSGGTLVRLLQLDPAANAPLGQFAYPVEAMHGPAIPITGQGQSGLSDLVALPGGRLLALERSLAFASPLLLTRIYEIDLAGASDVSALASLEGATFAPVAKSLLWTGDVGNMEGLALGPRLDSGAHLLVGVVDDGDGFSTRQVVVLRLAGLSTCPTDLSGSSDPSAPAYGRPDGAVDAADFFYYLDQFASGNLPVADISGSADPADPDYGIPDGVLDAADFFFFLDAFATGCG